MTTPVTPSRQDLVAALEAAANALKPVADNVYNDNGDLTVSSETLDYDQIVAAWRAEGRARRLLARYSEFPNNSCAALASEPEPQPAAAHIMLDRMAEAMWRSEVEDMRITHAARQAERWKEQDADLRKRWMRFAVAAARVVTAAPHPTEEPSNG